MIDPDLVSVAVTARCVALVTPCYKRTGGSAENYAWRSSINYLIGNARVVPKVNSIVAVIPPDAYALVEICDCHTGGDGIGRAAPCRDVVRASIWRGHWHGGIGAIWARGRRPWD